MEILLDEKEIKLLIALSKRHHQNLAYKLEKQMKEELLFEQACKAIGENDNKKTFLIWHEKLRKKLSYIHPGWIRWRFIGEKKGYLEPVLNKKEKQ